jgi:DNA-binding transcriptional regulator YiaG
VRGLKQQVEKLELAVASLRKRWAKQLPLPAVAVKPSLEVAESELRRARLTPEAIRRLRTRLGVTQAQLAALLGVTGPAIAQWESGSSKPRGRNQAALVALRKLGRRQVSRMLAARGIAPRRRSRTSRTR